jgi:hypothetical protein
VIETAAMLAIATTLVLAFTGGRPQTRVISNTVGMRQDPAARGPGPAQPARAGWVTDNSKPEQEAC